MNNDEKKIMVVDDNDDIVLVLKSILKKEGYNVIGAACGKECLDKLEKIRPDLILLDVMMPDIDGWEVCKKIKEDKSTSSIPVLMLTAVGNQKDIEESLKCANADMYLAKPMNLKEVKNTVGNILRGAT